MDARGRTGPAVLGLHLRRYQRGGRALQRWLYELAFAATKRPPSFLGMELWIQRRALTLLVMSDGPGVFNPREPVRSALVQCAQAAVARKLDELERTLAELQNVERIES